MTAEYIPQMCSVNEAHKRTGLAYQFIRGLVRNGKIPSVRSGKKILINFDKLVELISIGEAAYESAETGRNISVH